MNYRFLEDDDYYEISLLNLSPNEFENIRRLVLWITNGDKVKISNETETWEI